MASTLVDFVSQARGISFYGDSTSVGQHFTCYVEPHNRFDLNCVALMMTSGHWKLGHLARESAQFLAPLLRAARIPSPRVSYCLQCFSHLYN